MKSIIYFFTLFLTVTSFNSFADDYFVGEITAPEILSSFEQFKKHQDDVTYTDAQLAKLQKFKEVIEIKVYFGEWCHDSHRETPRLIKLFEQLDQDNYKLWYYAVDVRKSDPLGLAKADNLRRTPTVIVYRDGQEVGRILEVPRVDWATDIAGLLEL